MGIGHITAEVSGIEIIQDFKAILIDIPAPEIRLQEFFTVLKQKM